MNSDIILIGNSPSVLDYNLGKKINSFDKVVRFNNFQIKGYEEQIGTKCSYLARRSCDDVKLLPGDMFEQILCFVTYCTLTSGMKIVAQQVKRVYKDKCKIIDEYICKQYHDRLGLVYPQERASVGILAINYFLDKYDTICIHGFEHLKPVNGQVHHYFPTPPKDAQLHNGNKEETFVENLIQNGKIFRLTSD